MAPKLRAVSRPGDRNRPERTARGVALLPAVQIGIVLPSADLPVAIILVRSPLTLVNFLGVMGGALTFGLIGLFLGPVVLAVFYDLVVTWALCDASPKADEDPPS